MIGGELVSEGGYGCIFRPEINCSGETVEDSEHISKIQVYDKSAKKEIEVSKLLKTIKLYDNHFVPVLSHCFINVSEIETTDKKQCSIFTKQENGDFILLKMRNVDGDNFINYIVNNKNTREILNILINSYNHVLKSVKLLLEKRLVHYDLKGDNIMFDTKKSIPVLIDFGLSINMKKLNRKKLSQYFYVYAPEYYIWPLEVHYLCFLVKQNKIPNIIELKQMVNAYVNGHVSIAKNFSKAFIDKFKDLCEKQLLFYQSKSKENCIDHILKYWNTWDNYSLSTLYLKIIYYFNISGFVNNKFIVFLSELLLLNIHPNPKRRLTIQQSIEKFNTFILTSDINTNLTFDQLNKQFSEHSDNIKNFMKKDLLKTKMISKRVSDVYYGNI
mgnify:CR=1 FL=1